MLLDPPDVVLYFKLHFALMVFVNQRLKVLPGEFATPDDFSVLPPEVRIKVRDAFVSQPSLVRSFVDENPAGFSPDELDVVRSWEHLVHGHFYVLRELAKYTVFLSSTEPPVAYGVVALSQPLEDLIGPDLPVRTQAVLLPFKGRIVYDGLLTSYKISFGPGLRRSFNESYKEAKARQGIVTSLPMTEGPPLRSAPKVRRLPKPPSKAEKDDALRVIVDLIDRFCKDHLTEEYAVLCRKLAQALGRKRPSPLLHGSPNAWASGIVRAIGGVNFLHDKSQTPYLRSADIDRCFGTSPSSGAAKVAAIRKMLRMHPHDPDWTLPSRLMDNPMVWMLKVNGLLMDAREAPPDVQETAFRKGLIPFIPTRPPQAGE